MKNGFLIAAPQSGSGKTTVTLGIIAVLKRRGLTVQPFKCGPDFIDTGLLGRMAERAAYNLDIRMAGRDGVIDLFERKIYGTDIACVEGVMGLYDGGVSSSASLSTALDLPVIMVIDARGMAESAAAILHGFSTFDKDIRVAGVIFNNIGSKRHAELISAVVTDMPILGFLPKREGINIQSRHLGLYTVQDGILTNEFIQNLACLIDNNIDIDKLLEITACTREAIPPRPLALSDNPINIAVARDNAFCFYYEENIELLKGFGANILYFSPINGDSLPEDTSAVYLGGGYPELYAQELSENIPMIAAIRRFIDSGGPLCAECGGFMYLCRGITIEGAYYPMAGIYPVDATMGKRLQALGYRDIELSKDTIIGRAGTRMCGHLYHYSNIGEMPDYIGNVFDGSVGYAVKNCLAGYLHLHFGRDQDAARTFVEHARRFKKKGVSVV